jgi:hypothetical protein
MNRIVRVLPLRVRLLTFSSLLVLLIGVTVLVVLVEAAPAIPTSYCYDHYECREWRVVQAGCDCGGNQCYGWFRWWAKRYHVDRNCNETLVGSCTYKQCDYNVFSCCPPGPIAPR